MSDLDPLDHVDLSAIVAPPAPSGFAESVLARFASTEAAIAIEKRRRTRRARWTLGGAFTAIAAVLALVVAWPGGQARGSIVAETAREVSIGDTRVELAANASVEWRRDGKVLRIEQRGTATWHVPAGQQLHVDVPGTAAIDATNATLRVEVQMNAELKKVGATAAVVSAVTVAVIAGRATLAGGGKELAIEQGRAAAVSPGRAPVELITAEAPGPILLEVVYASREVLAPDSRLAELQTALARLALPPGSTVGALTYASGAVLNVHLTPAEILSETRQIADPKPGGLSHGLTAGVDAVAYASQGRRIVVVVGDGTETDPADELAVAIAAAKQKQVEIKSLVMHARDGVRPLDAFGVPVTDATKRSLAAAFGELVAAPRQAPVAVMVMFPAQPASIARDEPLASLAYALTHLDLPPGSSIGVGAYGTAASVSPMVAAESFAGQELEGRDNDKALGKPDVLVGVSTGINQVSSAAAPRHVVVILEDGSDRDISDRKRGQLKQQLTMARQHGIEVKSIIVRYPDSIHPSLLQTVGVPSVDATGSSLVNAVTAAIAPPHPGQAVMVVFAGRASWATQDLLPLEAIGKGLENLGLAPGSTVSAIEYSTGASIRIPWERAEDVRASQIGGVADYEQRTGSDLVQGVAMGLAELSKQKQATKVLVIIGDGIDTNMDRAKSGLADLDIRARKLGVGIRAIDLRSADSPGVGMLGLVDSAPIEPQHPGGIADALRLAVHGDNAIQGDGNK